jgi:hypothetical protein
MGKWVWSYAGAQKYREWVGKTTPEDVERLARRYGEILAQHEHVESDLLELADIIRVIQRYNDETNND